jgi:hypothetical protein
LRISRLAAAPLWGKAEILKLKRGTLITASARRECRFNKKETKQGRHPISTLFLRCPVVQILWAVTEFGVPSNPAQSPASSTI